ncbi:MAG: hypothetical protein WA833_04015 [Nitrosotalea sp.]
MIYVHRNRITNFLLKYKAGKIFLGIILAPYFMVLFVILYKMVKDPEWARLMTKINAQKKISDYC